jgi:hypothetical protein
MRNFFDFANVELHFQVNFARFLQWTRSWRAGHCIDKANEDGVTACEQHQDERCARPSRCWSQCESALQLCLLPLELMKRARLRLIRGAWCSVQ